MIKRHSTFWTRVAGMPTFLRLFVCGFWILAFIAMASTLLPGWTDEQGRPISTKEAWMNGDAPVSLLIAAVLYGLATLFYRRSSFARPAALIAFAGSWIFSIVTEWPTRKCLHVDLIIGSMPLMVIYLYLYRNRSVADYFRSQTTSAQQAAP
ncbi:MAG TPA: hypothetical protein VLO11_01920 [Luteolibacter sp.]|nr:hypothetical protein [Luteolibacter sp.]